MIYPPFFDKVEPLELYDPLADFLGAVEKGEITIEYIDVVKLAGHSCPTVAGAFLMAREGLKELFTDTLPIRGEIELFVKGAKDEGVNGVIANVIAFICGISDEGGFKGIGPKFNRANKIHFQADIPLQIRLKRLDTQEFVDISYDPSSIPADPRMKELMQKILSGHADIDERKLFQKLWQARVEKILFYENRKEIVKVKKKGN